MFLCPALDIMKGRCVVLEEGRRVSAVVFHDKAEEMVPYLCYGSDRLHIVDHDGADGGPRPLDMLARICRDARIPVQVAGGVKDAAAVDQLLGAGVQHVVLDNSLAKSPAILDQLIRMYHRHVIVALEAREGSVVVGGWASGATAIEIAQMADSSSVGGILYTDVIRQGQVRTPNIAAAQSLQAAVRCDVIASGGISSLEDISRMRDAKVHGCVVGRALYERRFTVLDAARAARM